MKCQDTFGFLHHFSFSHKLSSWALRVSPWATVPLFGSTDVSICTEVCSSEVWRKSRTSDESMADSHYCREIMALIGCWKLFWALYQLSETHISQNKYSQNYLHGWIAQSLLLPALLSPLTIKWPVAGSAVMASFWKVLAWTSSSSSLRSFSPASSSSSSSRLWERKRRMIDEDRKRDKNH